MVRVSLNVRLGIPFPPLAWKTLGMVPAGMPVGVAIFSMLAFVFSWVTMSTVAGNSTLPLT